MPIMDGLEATKEIKLLGFDVPVIGTTADKDISYSMFDKILVRPIEKKRNV